MSFTRKTPRVVCALLLAAAAAPSARAVAPDRYLPPDSEVVVAVNVRQILESPWVKKHALEHLRSELKKNAEARQLLEAAGLDPLKDISSLVIGAAGRPGAEPKFQAVVHGTFDLDKIHAALAAAAKAKPDELKVETKSGQKVYEIRDKEGKGKPLFAAFADQNTAVLSPSAEQTLAALGGQGGKVSAPLAAALEKISGKESVYVAGVITDAARGLLANVPQLKGLAPKLQYATGTFDLTNEFKLNVSVQTTEAAAAEQLKSFVTENVLPILELAVNGNEKAGPAAAEVLKQIELKTDRNALVISLAVSEQTLKKLSEAAAGPGNGGEPKGIDKRTDNK